MNNKGQTTIFLSILMGVLFIAAGFLFVNHLKDDVTTARAVDQLDCTNLTISDGAKVTCLAADSAVPYFFIIVLGGAISTILAKLL